VRRRVCVVVAAEMTVRVFLRNQIAAMQDDYDVTVIANTNNLAFLEEMGLKARLFPVPIARGISLRRDFVALVEVTRFLRREQFDLVHSITPKAGLLAMVGGLLARTPVRLHTFTGQVWATRTGITRELLKNIDRLLAASATLTIADSSSQRDFLLQQRVVSAPRSIVLGSGSVSGVDERQFHPDAGARLRIRRDLGIDPEDGVLLFVGRLNRDKGVLDLAQAFAHVATQRKDVRLLVVGTDEQKISSVMREACGPHADRLIFVDFTSEPQAFMAASDVLCLPSHREGFGTVIIEAAAVGLPAVASRIYGVVDAMIDGVTGLSHPPGDAKAIADTLLRILSDSGLRRRLGEAARERAVSDFSLATVTNAVLELYQRLLQGVSCHRTIASRRFTKRQLTDPLVAGERRPTAYQRHGKRAFDLLISGCALALLTPLLAVIAVLVRLRLGSPVLFRQQRPGLYGTPFLMAKFRTMTESRDAQGLLLRDAERLTPFGRFLRATSLDELPELFNVLNGDMSLIGPRPLLMRYLDRYTPEQARRHQLKPGVTGWAQINGRNELSWEDKFRLDVWYVDHCSFALDLRILAVTAWKLLTREGISQPGHVTAAEFMGSRNS